MVEGWPQSKLLLHFYTVLVCMHACLCVVLTDRQVGTAHFGRGAGCNGSNQRSRYCRAVRGDRQWEDDTSAAVSLRSWLPQENGWVSVSVLTLVVHDLNLNTNLVNRKNTS